jgi:hypothetical protein
MISTKSIFALTVLVGSVALTGCRGEAAPSKRSVRTTSNSTAPLAAKDAAEISFAGKLARPSHGEPRHEVFLSTYHSPESGISFRYPRNFALEEGDVQERSFFLNTQQDLDLEQPGATLVATVLVPEDGYPNTTFEHGSMQLITDESVTEKASRDSVAPRSTANASGSLALQGTPFRWTEQASETGGAKVVERRYAGYSQGTCYGFLLTVAADEAPDPDGFRKPADIPKIMKQLEKIVATTQIFNKSVTPPSEASEETAGRL